MKLPVFVSVGSRLTPSQQEVYDFFESSLEKIFNLDPRTVGQSDKATRPPLVEIVALAKHCSGGLILGFEEYSIEKGTRNSKSSVSTKDLHDGEDMSTYKWSTPWNQLEAGICKALDLPLMIFSEGVSGGIFDLGSSDLYVQTMPQSLDLSNEVERASILHTLASWQGAVEQHYYRK